MIKDPIVEEIRQHRKAHAAEHGNDLEHIVQSLRKREQKSDRPLLNLGPKKQFSSTESWPVGIGQIGFGKGKSPAD